MRPAKPVLFPLLLLAGCRGCSGDRLPAPPEQERVRVVVERLDRHLFGAPPDSMPVACLKAQATYGSFFRVFVEEVLQAGAWGDPALPAQLNAFVQDPDWRSVQRAIDSVFGGMEEEQRLLGEAFSRLRTAFPDSLVPRVVAFNSGYNYGIYPTDSVLGIGLEWFIGPDHPVIARLAPEVFPAFMKQRMRPAMLVPSALKGWLLVHFTRDIRGADVLTNLVEVGRIMALLDAMLPRTAPHLKYAFTPEQLAWCEANETMIWRELVANDKLFSRKAADIGRLMNDGPFTNGFPRESPGHIGEWIGHRMVQDYLKARPHTSFAELFAISDPRVILEHYKPR